MRRTASIREHRSTSTSGFGVKFPAAPRFTSASARDPLPLPRGRYYVWVGAYRYVTHGEELVAWQPVTVFDLYGPELSTAPRGIVRLAPVHVESSWELSS